MKLKISITAIWVLLAIFCFGQRSILKFNAEFRHEEGKKESAEIKTENKKYRSTHFKRKNKTLTQNSFLKSAQSVKLKLDSLVYVLWDENTNEWLTKNNKFSYDTYGNNTQDLGYYWDYDTNQWVAYKEEYSHDANGSLTLYVYSVWDKTLSQWENYDKIEYTYDLNGKMILDITYDWDESNTQWENYEKTEYIYDVNSNITREFRHYWNEDITQWVGYSKQEFMYDANNNKTQLLEYDWDEITNLWIVSYKREYTYDDNNNNITILGFYWDEITTLWLVSHKYEYTFDANNNNTKELRFAWDEGSSQWKASEQNEYIYDVNNNMTSYLHYESAWGGPLTPTYKVEYIYDSNDNMTREFFFFWDIPSNQWIAYSKSEYTFDNSFSFSDLLLPYLFTEESSNIFSHMLVNFAGYSWDEISNLWVMDENDTLYYSEHNSNSISEIKKTEVNIYPNPVFENLTFKYFDKSSPITFELFDSQGRKVMFREIKSDENVDMQKLKQGIYFYSLTTNRQKQTGKLIKE